MYTEDDAYLHKELGEPQSAEVSNRHVSGHIAFISLTVLWSSFIDTLSAIQFEYVFCAMMSDKYQLMTSSHFFFPVYFTLVKLLLSQWPWKPFLYAYGFWLNLLCYA